MTKENKLMKELTLTIPAQDFEKKIAEKLEDIQKKVKVDGFRVGQVPMKIVESKYKASVMGEALDEAITQALDKEIKAQNIRPALTPKLSISKFEEGQDIVCDVKIELLPEITDVDVSKLNLTKLTADVDDEDITKTVDRLQLSRRRTEAGEEKRETRLHDVVVIDFKGSIDGEAFKGGEGKDYYLDLGSNTFIPGFEDQLIGKQIGEEVDVNVTFPENYHAKDLAGKKALFKTTIKEIRKVILPELNDEFAKDFGADTMDALKEMIKMELSKEYDHVSKNHLKREILDLLDTTYPFEVPQGLIDIEFDAIWKQIEQAKQNNTLDPEDVNKSDEDLKTEYKKIAERRVRLGLLLAEIAKTQKISVSQEDLNKAILEQTRRYPGQEKQVLDHFKNNPKAIETLQGPLLEAKVMDYIMDNAKIEEKKVSVQELYDYDPDKK